ncbi:MAG TPA: hypothetical protein VFM38_00180 [Candidatus Limnocylindrales bacterium]|nr:hypothetical protein [Candidatus Limnocylindrales bacterium]
MHPVPFPGATVTTGGVRTGTDSFERDLAFGVDVAQRATLRVRRRRR